jgi:hypothetical protein
MTSRREVILARAAALASSDSDASDDVSTREGDGARALGRRRRTVPLEERAIRRDAPYLPPGDRSRRVDAAAARPAAAAATANRGEAASTSGVETFSRAERAAKEDARLLTRLPEGERPMVTQEFSMRAPAKVPRAARQRFLDALAAKKLRASAGVGAREDVGTEWMETHSEARARAVREAIEEEMKIHARATSKVTYRNLTVRLMMRGGESEKPVPGALMQEYRCAEADVIDLSRAAWVRGDAVRFFVDACKHRSGNAHPRWLEESAGEEDGERVLADEEDGETTDKIVIELENDRRSREVEAEAEAAKVEKEEDGDTVSPEAVVAKVCREFVKRLVETGACDTAVASVVQRKAVQKIMDRHVNAPDASFVERERKSIEKLVSNQAKHESSRRTT